MSQLTAAFARIGRKLALIGLPRELRLALVGLPVAQLAGVAVRNRHG